MTRILVTGASGFIGRHVLPTLLDAGCEVHTVGRTRPSTAAGAVVHHEADLLDPDVPTRIVSAAAPQVILHLAWTVEHGRFWTAPENLDWVAATLHLARAAQRAGVRRFVGLGTCVEYDWSDGGAAPRQESDPLAPTTLYGEAKAATFRLLSRAFAAEPATFAWARLFHPFGAGEPSGKLVASLIESLKSGVPIEIRTGDLVRDFIAVQDAGDAIARLALSDVSGPVNIGSGEAVAIRQLALMLEQASGASGLLRFAASPAGQTTATMAADVGRLRNEVGVPAPPPLAQRLRELLGAHP